MKVGLAIMRMQPMHMGHYALISRMMTEMDTVIIGLGSIQDSGSVSNPFSPKQRREMIEKVFGQTGKYSKIKIIELKDIGVVTKIAWAMHVFGKIDGLNLPAPTHYYAGSKHDASWFESVNTEFKENRLNVKIVDRLKDTICMSGTEIRKAIISDDISWEEYVPPVLVDYIRSEFPTNLLLSENIDVFEEKQKFESGK